MPRLGHHSHHQPGIPGHGPAPDCPGPRRHHSRGTSGKWKTAFQLAFCIASLLALTWTHTPEYLPSFLDQLAALCLWHGSGASNFLYQFTLWGSIILTVYSGAVYCVGARKFFQH